MHKVIVLVFSPHIHHGESYFYVLQKVIFVFSYVQFKFRGLQNAEPLFVCFEDGMIHRKTSLDRLWACPIGAQKVVTGPHKKSPFGHVGFVL